MSCSDLVIGQSHANVIWWAAWATLRCNGGTFNAAKGTKCTALRFYD